MRWKELGDFLRARRAEADPTDFGLDLSGATRRVPGLRREEVAEAASISTIYYARLEQGRMPASAPVLSMLAEVLRLTADQRRYLFELAGKENDEAAGPTEQMSAPVRRVLDDLTSTPAFVLGRRTQIVGWNALAAALIADFASIPEHQRTFIRLLFSDPSMQSLYADWPGVVDLAIAQLRMESARDPADALLSQLIDEVTHVDARFADLWANHRVATRDSGTKTLHHRVVGELTLDWQALSTAPPLGQTIIVWTAEPGSVSRLRLEQLESTLR